MSDNVKVVSSNTIIKKITVGTPLPTIAQVKVVSTVEDLSNVATQDASLDVSGQLLIYNLGTGQYEASAVLDNQTIDAGEGF